MDIDQASDESKRILVIDDEANIRLMFRTVLSTAGYEVAEAGNGEIALALLREKSFDVAILDLNMPVLDGMSVLKALQDNPPLHPPRVVVLTAYGSIRTAVKATRLGALDFLEKPITPSDLRASVAAVLAAPEPAATEDNQGRNLDGGYEGVLNRVRRALRMLDTDTAETLLMKAADLAEHDANYFNLLGVLYEARHQRRLARKFYGLAIKKDKKFEPAQQNMRRLFEMERFGRTEEAISLGDEALEVWYAKLPH